MSEKPCPQCIHYRYVPDLERATCGDNGRSVSFMRAEIGLYGEPHCGPEGKLWRERG